MYQVIAHYLCNVVIEQYGDVIKEIFIVKEKRFNENLDKEFIKIKVLGVDSVYREFMYTPFEFYQTYGNLVSIPYKFENSWYI